ncbi:MAG: DEAD/DEAH box helicase [Candidatus Micrarchaeia archaeon]
MLDDYNPKWFVQKGKGAQYDDSVQIHEAIREVLKGRGIKKLYSHQSLAIKKIREGKNIVLMAPTAAGKSECYMVPVVEAALRGKCSLLLFPTKALSRDQWARVREFGMLGIRAEVYDGDTPASKRAKIRADMPHVIITNVDMLHFMLTNNKLWKNFFARLKYVVIDEIHAYSGNVGCHVANIMWRLQRLLKAAKKEEKENELAGKKKFVQGSLLDLDDMGGIVIANEQVQYIVSSATIGNPIEFASKICLRDDFELIEGDGAPRGKINHAIVNSSDESVVTTCLKIAKEINKKTIIFANSHNMAERLSAIGHSANMEVAVYRAGILPEERRRLESGFHSGRIKVLAATSALELGMDIGDADAAILAGFPGTVTQMRQRVGRVGRKGQESYAIMVARQLPLDQYYAQNPKNYIEGKPEECYANAYNEHVRALHIMSACKDRPIMQNELREEDIAICSKLKEEGLVRNFSDMFVATKEGVIKARKMSVRNAGHRIKIIDADSGKSIGEREMAIGIGELYEGATYLLGGKRFESLGIDMNKKTALVRRSDDDGQYYTQALKTKNAEILKIEKNSRWNLIEMGMGRVHIVDEVHGYVVKDSFSGATVSRHEIDEPLSYEFDTRAFWADWDVWAEQKQGFTDGLHALEHVSIAMMPALSGADASEIGGISYPDGRIFYYEGIEGGSGLSEVMMKRYGECISMSHERLAGCECVAGCPKCIFSPQCGNNNYYLNKKEALSLAMKGLGISGE